MSRLLSCVLALCSALNCIAMECTQIRVASGTTNWAPISYRTPETHQYQGVAFDVADKVSKELGIPLTILDLPWKRMLLYLQGGELDMALAIYKNKEREEKYLYTDSYFTNEARVFVKKGLEFPFNRLDDLIGHAGMVPAGGSFGEEFDAFSVEQALNLTQIHTNPASDKFHRLVLNERKDYYIADFRDGLSSLKAAGLQDKIIPLSHPIGKTYVHFALSRKSPCRHLIQKINRTIEQLERDGDILRMSKKYLDAINKH